MDNKDYRWSYEEYDAINRVIKSGCFTMGKEVEEFEYEIAKYFERSYAVMVNSGSSANLVAIASMIYDSNINLKPGDEVIVPTVSWATTYAPLLQYGLKLVFVDISEKTLNLNIEKIENAINKKTRMILAVNLLGNPMDYEKITDICEYYNLYLMVDNCESIGAKYKNCPVEKFGLISTVSMFYSHHITTMEGGVAFTDDIELYNIMKSVRAHGWTRETHYNNMVEEFYKPFTFKFPGYNVRPLEIEAAIGKCQLSKLKKFICTRRKNGEKYISMFSKHEFVDIQHELGDSSWFGFAFILKDNAPYTRDEIVGKLVQEGIETRPIVAGDFLLNPVIEYYDYRLSDNDEIALKIHQKGFFIYNNIIDMTKRFECLYDILK